MRQTAWLKAPFTAASLPGFPGLLNALLAGMTAPVGLFQVGDGEVQVTLGGRQRTVAEHFLDVAQVRLIFKRCVAQLCRHR